MFVELMSGVQILQFETSEFDWRFDTNRALISVSLTRWHSQIVVSSLSIVAASASVEILQVWKSVQASVIASKVVSCDF